MSETIVFKVGTSTLIHETGRLNLQRMEELVEVISDIMNRGNRVCLLYTSRCV